MVAYHIYNRLRTLSQIILNMIKGYGIWCLPDVLQYNSQSPLLVVLSGANEELRAERVCFLRNISPGKCIHSTYFHTQTGVDHSKRKNNNILRQALLG